MDMPIYPGDPLTPGWASERGGKKLDRARRAKTLLKIPVLPISYGDALPLLRSLRGPVAPEAWRGALPITYHVGPGASKVHLKLAFDWQQRPLYNVIARIPGVAVPGRVGHPRQPSRRLGQRRLRSDQRQRRADGNGARPRRAAEDRLAAEAHDHHRLVGRRGVGPARIDRVGREAPAGARAPRRWPTSTATAPARAGCGWTARTRCRRSSTRSRATCPTRAVRQERARGEA